MTTTEQQHAERIEYHSECIVGCGMREAADEGFDHGPYCERSVGSVATGHIEPEGAATQFWTSVISPHSRGRYTAAEHEALELHRDGVQLRVETDGKFVPDELGDKWQFLLFNLTPGEARQLAAQLVAAADSHDGINGDHFVLRRLEKIASRVGADIWGA